MNALVLFDLKRFLALQVFATCNNIYWLFLVPNLVPALWLMGGI